jgi:hypothetical protein
MEAKSKINLDSFVLGNVADFVNHIDYLVQKIGID